jgi:hypothetical protein
MRPRRCFELNKELERAAEMAEERKVQAIDKLNSKLIAADQRALQEKGKTDD